MSEEIQGTKETKELLIALLKVTPILLKQFKDGAQVQDATELYEKIVGNAEMKAVILQAYEGYKLVPGELKDLSVKEGISLASELLPELFKVIDELKK